MKGKAFVDTNILVYAHNLDAGKKNEIAAKAISRLWESKLGVISTQVLQELYVTLTRKLPQPLGRSTVGRLLKSYLSRMATSKSPTCGHFKIPHPCGGGHWSIPTEGREDFQRQNGYNLFFLLP